MIWYNTGTISVANGSTIVTAVGAAFINNVAPGAGFITGDGRVYPVDEVNSDGQLTLAVPYQGATIAGAAYYILPTQAYDLMLARRIMTLTDNFADVRDGVGQGMFPAGTVAAPGMRFANDQDTGVRSKASNEGALVAGGQDRVVWSAAGLDVTADYVSPKRAGIRIASPIPGTCWDGTSVATAATRTFAALAGWSSPGVWQLNTSDTPGGDPVFPMILADGNTRNITLCRDAGNLLVGTGVGNYHIIRKAVAEGEIIALIDNGTDGTVFYGANTGGASGVAAAMRVPKNTTTNRSGNFAGTINASGADYAEYILKAAGCGLIAKGDVCGVDVNGHLTKSWADAISFVVKSTDPSLVGGDAWAKELRARPSGPGAAPSEPTAPTAPEPLGTEPAPVERAEGESDDDFAARVIAHAAATSSYQDRVAEWAAFHAAMSALPGLVAQYQSALAGHQSAVAEYEADLADWESELEALRARVDRIAFSGQVPCNVTGDFAVGDYIAAAANGGGIKAIAVPEADMTLPLYMKRIGKVWAVTDDGRAWIDVQHG